MTIICNNVFALFAILNFGKLTQAVAAATAAGNTDQHLLVRFWAFLTDRTAEWCGEGHENTRILGCSIFWQKCSWKPKV